MLKKLEKKKRELEKNTGHTCDIEESEDGHIVKCSGITGGSNILSSSKSGMVLMLFIIKILKFVKF